jgi:hypothetical protein
MLGLEGGSTPIQHLNEQMKRVRRFERDILYVRAILNSTVQQEIEGTVLSSSDGRVELWIPCWQRVIRTREEGTWATGQAVLVRLFYDPSKRAWKKRIPMVLRPAP